MSNERIGFGPWSSALDNGTRLELSAFWRRRMAGLGRLPLGRTRRRWHVAVVVAALLVGATPLVEFSSQAIAEGEQDGVEKLSGKVAGEKFVWRFSNGLEVELIGLAKNPSKDQSWWRPDGTPLEDASLPVAKFRTDGRLAREIAFRWRHLSKDQDQTRLWTAVPQYDGAGGAVTVEEPDGSQLEVEGVAFSGDAKEVTIRITASVAATPWKTLSSSDGKHASSAGVLVDGRHRGMAFAIAHETEAGTAITVTFSLEGDSGRVIAVDKRGKEHVASRANQVGSMGFMQGTFTFDRLSRDEIERFELQMQRRKLETVEFRNVSLEAGRASKVVIEPLKVDHQGIETGSLPDSVRAALTKVGQQRIDRSPILGPITSGDEIAFLDPPSDEEVLRAFRKTQRGILQDMGLKKVEDLTEKVDWIEKEKVDERIDPMRVYPLIGPARQVHSLYRCTIRLKDGSEKMFAVDHHHLHMGEGAGSESKAAKTRDESTGDGGA